jgi:low affinity Fe/Cu permease
MAQKEDDIILNIEVKYSEALDGINKYTKAISDLKIQNELAKKELKEGSISQDEYNKAIAANKIAMDANKKSIQALEKEIQNNIKYERENVGSLEQLKAELSLNTAAYNKLSEAERNSVKGEVFQKQIAETTQKLKDAEEALGNHRRSVGDYGKATRDLGSELSEHIKRLAELKLAGEQNSEEYQDLSQKAAELKDAIDDVNKAITSQASDTSNLEGLNQLIQTLVGSYGLYKSATAALGIENESLDETITKLTAVMTALSSAQAIQKALLKESSLMTAIANIQSKARTAALAAETKGTAAAGVAQKLFNFIASMNPYVLLATALITVVGALLLFSKNTDEAAEKQKKLNEQQKIFLDYVENENRKITILSEERIKEIERQIKILEAQGGKEKEIRALEDQIAEERRNENKRLAENSKEQLENLNQNIEKLEMYRNEIIRLNGEKLNPKADTKLIEKQLETIQKIIDNLERDVQIGVTVKTKIEDDENAEQVTKAKREKAAKDAAKAAADAAKERVEKQREAIRQAEDAALAIVKEGVEKQRLVIELSYSRQIEDLKRKLNTEKNLTIEARQAINQTITSLQEQQKNELLKLSDEEIRIRIETETKKIELRLAAVKEGSEAEYQLRLQQLLKQEEAELAAVSENEELKKLIRAKYEKQYEDLETTKTKNTITKQSDSARLEWENRLLQIQQGSQAEYDLKVQAAQAEYDALLALDETQKAALYESDTAYTNALLENKRKLEDAEKSQQAAITEGVTMQLQAAQAIGSGFEQVLNAFAEDNEALAGFAKTIALFNIGLSTAEALAKGTAAAQSVPFPGNLVAIATTIGTVLANIAKAKQLVSKDKTPKAPKFATGGSVSGQGSGTSDSIVANLSNGESILTAQSTAMFAPLLSALNQMGGGVPISIVQSSQQVMGEEMLARAFAKGVASLPAPVVSVEEINSVSTRVKILESLSLQ